MDLEGLPVAAGWGGYEIDEGGVAHVHSNKILRVRNDVEGPLFTPLELVQLDRKDVPGAIWEEQAVADVITMLDGMYDGRSTRPLAPPTCVMTAWGIQWLKRAVFGDVQVKKVALEAIKEYDLETNDPLDYVETHVTTHHQAVIVQGKTTKTEEVVRTKKVLKKGHKTKFASALAMQAYNKFGARDMTPANTLVTRRWLMKQLDAPEYKDLRTCDKNVAIDRALFLSFIPTEEFRRMKVVSASRAWHNRTQPSALLNGIFGRAFRLSADVPADGMHFN